MAARSKPPAGRNVGGKSDRLGMQPPGAEPVETPAANPFVIAPVAVPDQREPLRSTTIRRDQPVRRAHGHVLTERGWVKE